MSDARAAGGEANQQALSDARAAGGEANQQALSDARAAGGEANQASTVSAAGGERSRLQALTVSGWFRLLLAVLVLLLLASSLLMTAVLSHGRAVTRQLDAGLLPAQAQAYRLQGALVDQETGVRGYALTGADPRFLQPYTDGRAIESSAAAAMRAELGGYPGLLADLTRIESAAGAWRRSYASVLITDARNGSLSSRDQALLISSKQAFDHLRALFADQNSRLMAAAARKNQSLASARTAQNWAFAAILICFVAAMVVFSVLLSNAVLRPLNRLRASTRAVATGGFGHPIELAGPADVRAVAADVDAMRRELVAAIDEARAAQQVALSQAEDLNASSEELRRSNAELEQFAYVASHDLQEPLRKVASFCQLLEKRYADQLDDRGRQYIDFAVDGAKRMQRLINDLLAFSRVGRSGDVRVPVPLGQPLDAAIAALQVAVEESGAVIERPDQLPEVLGDPTLLTMLWQNLIGNAIKFRAPDRAPAVRITAEPGAGQWQLCVTDNGIGIAPEFADKVFVIFQRLHRREAYPGTGIGLALCKRIVEQHGGQISIDTGHAGGTRICLTLPAVPAVPDGDGDGAPDPDAGITTTDSEGIPA